MSMKRLLLVLPSWYFEEGLRGWGGSLKRALWFFEEGGMVF